MPDALMGAIVVGENYFPMFPIVVFAAGLVIVLAMIWVIYFTRAGILLRAEPMIAAWRRCLASTSA